MKALVIGATGMVGSELIRQLIAHPDYDLVRTLTRRPISVDAPKIESHQIDFDDIETAEGAFHDIDHVFSCFGTTLSAVRRDRKLFRKIDLDYPLATAQVAARAGTEHFIFVSSVEADSNGKIFQSRVKGDLESALAEVALPRITAVQPSFLDGQREKMRLDERVLMRICRVLSPLLQGSLRKYRAIAVADVARDMILTAAGQPTRSHMRVTPLRP